VNIVDLLTTIIGVTVVVTITLSAVAYLAYRLRRARHPVAEELPVYGPWYFVRYDPDRPEPHDNSPDTTRLPEYDE
jgi:hypothetical protein